MKKKIIYIFIAILCIHTFWTVSGNPLNLPEGKNVRVYIVNLSNKEITLFVKVDGKEDYTTFYTLKKRFLGHWVPYLMPDPSFPKTDCHDYSAGTRDYYYTITWKYNFRRNLPDGYYKIHYLKPCTFRLPCHEPLLQYRAAASSPEALSVAVRNHSGKDIMLNGVGNLEKYENGEWVRMDLKRKNLPMAFEVKKDEEKQFDIYWKKCTGKKMAPGRYRMIFYAGQTLKFTV